VRIGLYPNLGVCWYTTLICGPGRPTLAVVDFAAPYGVFSVARRFEPLTWAAGCHSRRKREPETAGAAGDGYYFACGCLDATTAPAAAAFNTAYTAKFNTPPSTYSPEAFDATNAMIDAIKTAAGKGTVTRQAVESAISALDYKGITTAIKFAPNGEVEAKNLIVNLFQQKKGVIVGLGDITKIK